MSSDVVRKVGRGGAGNFFSKASEDLEAQDTRVVPPPVGAPATAASPAPGPTLTRTGRGGAGNLHDPAANSSDPAERESVAKKLRAVVKANLAKPRAGLSGRGGAGNWAADTSAAAVDREEREKKEALDAQVLRAVEAGLPTPPRTYHLHNRDMV